MWLGAVLCIAPHQHTPIFLRYSLQPPRLRRLPMQSVLIGPKPGDAHREVRSLQAIAKGKGTYHSMHPLHLLNPCGLLQVIFCSLRRRFSMQTMLMKPKPLTLAGVHGSLRAIATNDLDSCSWQRCMLHADDADEAQAADAGGGVRLAADDRDDQGRRLGTAQAGPHQADGVPLPVRVLGIKQKQKGAGPWQLS